MSDCPKSIPDSFSRPTTTDSNANSSACSHASTSVTVHTAILPPALQDAKGSVTSDFAQNVLLPDHAETKRAPIDSTSSDESFQNSTPEHPPLCSSSHTNLPEEPQVELSLWHALLPSRSLTFRSSTSSKTMQCIDAMAQALTKMLTEDVLAEVMEGIDTLHIYARNLAQSPGDPRFHSISATNVHFRERLGHLAASQDAMRALGYELRGDSYKLDPNLIPLSPAELSGHGEQQCSNSLPTCPQHANLGELVSFLAASRTRLRERFALLPDRLPPAHAFTSVRGVGWAADRGRRASMEDDEIIVDGFCGDPTMGYFGLYDGHGGRETVDFVVKTLHANLSHVLQTIKQRAIYQKNNGSPTASFASSLSSSSTVVAQSGTTVTSPYNTPTTISTESMDIALQAPSRTLFSNQVGGCEPKTPSADNSCSTPSPECVMSATPEPSTTTTVTTSSSAPSLVAIGAQQPAASGNNNGTASQSHSSSLSTFASALRAAYLRTDGQLRRVGILRSGSTSVSCVVRQVNTTPLSGATLQSNSNDTNTADASSSPANHPLPTVTRALVVANVGDSRAVLCRGGVAVRLTVDHRASRPEEARRVRAAGGFVSPNQRVNGILAVSRALGDHLLKENGHPILTAAPHCVETVLSSRDRFLILACDGLWDVMSDQTACDIVGAMLDGNPMTAQNSTATITAMSSLELNTFLCQVAKALVKDALDRLSKDNITAMIVLL